VGGAGLCWITCVGCVGRWAVLKAIRLLTIFKKRKRATDRTSWHLAPAIRGCLLYVRCIFPASSEFNKQQVAALSGQLLLLAAAAGPGPAGSCQGLAASSVNRREPGRGTGTAIAHGT
jgi:hypothetical protein